MNHVEIGLYGVLTDLSILYGVVLKDTGAAVVVYMHTCRYSNH